MNNSEKQFTKEMVESTLQLWCDNVVLVGKTYAENGDVKKLATQILSDNYDYDKGKVLFKPTLAFASQTFRSTKEGALAYFIGGDNSYPDDKGFKLKPWVKVWYNKLDYIC
ncbi:MAG: hypothetical protein FJX99_02120, partial [Bacteroidetes bacterium]|nr:hypothetical protein [Bacteroidota bacterium]